MALFSRFAADHSPSGTSLSRRLHRIHAVGRRLRPGSRSRPERTGGG
ncbi:hypothetical protein SLNWT_3414 [Streptomyces albus]|uniref:Uncharacterized protein n=1 Tax=Streptomyces albus (strain ATCC 21838 / DSM 41398 / FERM P-419 / JCM 4703 / NBRC 107858) TaxID=1081613 RepID=A0A0B5EX36_STRA4|nr:hypothetical protein SLNWT_3414 [Streptomyces albus]AYN33851.1 hypothetical protein DUI70_3350 [Streptomyces albus]